MKATISGRGSCKPRKRTLHHTASKLRTMVDAMPADAEPPAGPGGGAELAVRALEQTWTVDKTEAEVAQFRQRHGLGGKGGRPPMPAVVKQAGALQRAAKALGKKPDFNDLDDKARAQLRKDLESARAVLDAWLAGF